MTAAEIAIRGVKTMQDLQAFSMTLLREIAATDSEDFTPQASRIAGKAYKLVNKMTTRRKEGQDWGELADELAALFQTTPKSQSESVPEPTLTAKRRKRVSTKS